MTTPDLYNLELEFPMDFAERLKASHKDGINAATVNALKFWVLLGDDTWNTITKQANLEGVSRAEFVRKAVNLMMFPEAPAYVNLRKDLPLAERRKARDADIGYRALRGAPRSELAKQYGLSEIRVHQIVAAAKKKLVADKIKREWTADPYENT